jgi:hypothetical protein
MKRIFIYFILFQLIFTACKKSEVESLFDVSANQRAKNQVDNYKKLLSGSEFGWRAEYYPDGGSAGGYSFYLKFDATSKVSMFSDVNGFFYFPNGYDKAFETTYQVKSLQKPTLIFDSYSYLHELVNPDYNGGTGQAADLELEFTSPSDNSNTVTLVGRANRTQMKLTKLTKAESDILAKGGLANTFNSTINYVRNSLLSLVLPTGEKADVVANFNTKIFALFYVQNNQVRSISSAFSVTTTGIQLREFITLFGVRFNELIWDDVLKLYYINADGRRINFTQSNQYTLPFNAAVGNLFSVINFDPTTAGQNPNYVTLFNTVRTNILTFPFTPPLTLTQVEFEYLPSDDIYVLRLIVTSAGRNFACEVYYDRIISGNGNNTFVKLGVNGNANALASRIKPLTDILERDTFNFDYDPTNGKLALLRSVTTPTFSMKGRLE